MPLSHLRPINRVSVSLFLFLASIHANACFVAFTLPLRARIATVRFRYFNCILFIYYISMRLFRFIRVSHSAFIDLDTLNCCTLKLLERQTSFHRYKQNLSRLMITILRDIVAMRSDSCVSKLTAINIISY